MLPEQCGLREWADQLNGFYRGSLKQFRDHGMVFDAGWRREAECLGAPKAMCAHACMSCLQWQWQQQ